MMPKGGGQFVPLLALSFEAAVDRNGKLRLRDEGSQLLMNCIQLKHQPLTARVI
jgi:hypothetical protein